MPIHQGNSGSYTLTKGTAVPTTTLEEQRFLYSPWEQWFLPICQGTAVPTNLPGNNSSYNSLRNSGSHERVIAVSNRVYQGNGGSLPQHSSHGEQQFPPAHTADHVVTASLFKGTAVPVCRFTELLGRGNHTLFEEPWFLSSQLVDSAAWFAAGCVPSHSTG